MKRKVIAIHGKMGSGKSTLARTLEARLRDNAIEDFLDNWAIDSFANPLKEAVAIIGFPEYDVETGLRQPKKSDYSSVVGMSYGRSLQFIGSLMRDHVAKDVWVKSWEQRTADRPLRIIDDLRMPDELEYLKNMESLEEYDLFLIKISQVSQAEAKNILPVSTCGRDKEHESEKGLDAINFDAVVTYRPDEKEIDYLLRKMKACGFLDSECAC